MTRRGFLVLAVAAVAAAAACAVTALRPTHYTGEIELVVGHGNAPLDPQAARDARMARALRDLVASHVLAANVIRSMQLDESQDQFLGRMSVAMPQPAVLRIAVTDTDRRRATLTASTTGLVFIRLVQSRFGIRGYGMPLKATIWDPARATREDRVGHILENGGLAAVISTIAALGLLRLPRRPRPAGVATAATRTALAAEPDAEPEAELEPQPDAAPPPLPVARVPGDARRNLRALEQLVESHAGDYPADIDEWRSYVVHLREFAAPDGTLPASLDALVGEVFGDLLAMPAPRRAANSAV